MRFVKLSQLNTKHQVEKELYFLHPLSKPTDKFSLERHIAPNCWKKFIEENLQKNSFLEKCYLSKLSAKSLKRNVLCITALLARFHHCGKDLSKCNIFYKNLKRYKTIAKEAGKNNKSKTKTKTLFLKAVLSHYFWSFI